MAFLPLILTCFLISEISSYSITPIAGMNGVVENVNFDAEGNTYVTVYFNERHSYFYKLNPSNEVLSVTTTPNKVSETLVSSRGDAFFLFFDGNSTVGILRSNSTEVEVVDEMSSSVFHLDNNGNLFYSNPKGISVIRPDSPASSPIINLEDKVDQFRGRIISDKSGKTYIPVKNETDYLLALVTQEALQEEKPYATFVNHFENTTRYVGYLMIDKDETLWISIVDKKKGGVIQRLTKGDWETVLTDTGRPYNTMVQGKEKTNVIATDDSASRTTSVYYVTSKDEVVEIPELNNLTAHTFAIYRLADSEGQVYLHSTMQELSPSLGKLITVKPDDPKPIPITFGNHAGEPTELVAKLDYNDDLWFVELRDQTYHLKKGEIVPDIVDNSNGRCTDPLDVNVNFVTRTIYVSCLSGLFTVKDN